MMQLRVSIIWLAACVLLAAGPSLAQIGVTDNCQDDIKKLEDDIRDDRDDYTAESIAKATAELTAAKTNRLNPVKCRKNIQDARQALREGKRDKKDRD
jgi:hypothetical protein